ncbi:B3 domain-containing protein Os01g0234100 isoform X3 [Triticum aestivum]|uniref:B3 domain-containing protein Os01g0234100 isoform X3 n=1 Tax=Triticum aestivum TaxID=4565 RepID=UPI001D007F9F|nr:B3 domain-containing protein Os01g0234100-like isoform X3 [Triticum aestivum]
MAIDEPAKSKRGAPAGDPHSAKSKTGQKMVHRRRPLLDEGSSSRNEDGDGDDDFEPMAMGGTPAGYPPHSARTKMGQKMSLAHRRLSLLDDGSSISRHIAAAAAAADDVGGGSEQMGEEFAVDVAQKNTAVDDSDDPDGSEDDFVPLIMMRTKNVKSEPGKHPGLRYKHKTQRTINKTYKRKKTGRSAGPVYAKRKVEKKPRLVGSNNISKISDDDGQKKYASVLGFYATAFDRALEVEKKLPAEGPSFVKLMQISHVVRVFWLGVPVSFCREHLPNHDVTIVLEDEDGHRFDTNYLARKQGLSGGWNRFATRHHLKVGDAVVFQLVEPTRFKVYILRESKFSTTDGALSLLSLDTSMENNMPAEKGEDTSDEDAKSREDPEVTKVVTNKASDDDSNDLFSEAAANGGVGSPDPDPDFDAVKTFRTFKMAIDSSVIDHKLVQDRLLWTYYKLCGDRKAFLHRRLPKHINLTLAAGVIVETASIAEGIRSYPSSCSSCEDLAAWKKTLESFELLGMDVGFIRERLDELLFLLDARSSDDHPPEGYEEVKLERARAAEKVRALESKMASLKDALKDMEMEMEEIAEKRRGHALLQLAAAPW